MHDDDEVETEWDEALALATEEELVDLAGTCVCVCVRACMHACLCVSLGRQFKHFLVSVGQLKYFVVRDKNILPCHVLNS